MDRHLAIAINRAWLRGSAETEKRLQQNLLFLGRRAGGLRDGALLYVRFRDSSGHLRMEEASVRAIKDNLFVKSEELCGCVESSSGGEETLLMFLEGFGERTRCILVPAPAELWEAMATLDPPLRPSAFDLPPTTLTAIEAEDIYTALYELLAGGDTELFGENSTKFLRSPHILVPLFAHVLSLSSKDNIDFPLILKTTAEQLRFLLTDSSVGPSLIHKIEREHAKLWSDVLGERIAFVDGGMSRIAGLPSVEPLALRVGVYSVIPGEIDLREREEWELAPYVIGDLIKRVDGYDKRPEPKRLQEAARYVLEPLTALRYVARRGDAAFLFMHGPLVNQFAVYNEGEPNYLPVLDASFLDGFGIDQATVERHLSGLPKSPKGELLWNQFMAIYGVLMKSLFGLDTPIAGVIERTVGKWIARGVLARLVAMRRMTEGHAAQIEMILEQYDISDDFLFGCVLEEGEYLEPMLIAKNPERRAVPHWAEVVRQYPNPYATVMKTSATSFPYRVEMNPAALANKDKLLRLLYHTSRLLPRYAFPVGLDIVDKYAKVPDWLSHGVSARITADVLRRALNTGDPKIVAQIRQFLAHTPRDFFYRPQSQP